MSLIGRISSGGLGGNHGVGIVGPLFIIDVPCSFEFPQVGVFTTLALTLSLMPRGISPNIGSIPSSILLMFLKVCVCQLTSFWLLKLLISNLFYFFYGSLDSFPGQVGGFSSSLIQFPSGLQWYSSSQYCNCILAAYFNLLSSSGQYHN